jgi:homopolymeric O-antigen transport system permease protein
MSAAYLNPQLKVEPAARRVHARFEIRNNSQETWNQAEGFAIGYHLFDADTGTLIVDGPRVHFGDLKPGESAQVGMEIEVPSEDGDFQMWISPLREDVCWYYERGWPFLLVTVKVDKGQARLERTKVTTRPALRRAVAIRSLGRGLVYPVLTVWRNRSLIRVMVRREILGRYRGSFGGSFWTVISPLLLILTYFFIFSVVMRASFPGDSSRAGYVLYFIAGMLPWLAFSEAAGRAPGIVLEHRNFVKKLVFAVETLPFNLVTAGLVSEFFATLLYCVLLLVVRHSLPLTVLWLPALLIPQVLFTAGVSWFLAALGAFVRDLGQLIGFVLTIWFFMTPICYPEESWKGLPKLAVALLAKNPICILVRGYRAIFLEHHAPAFGPLWKFWILATVVFVLGHAWFYKLRKSFADMI